MGSVCYHCVTAPEWSLSGKEYSLCRWPLVFPAVFIWRKCVRSSCSLLKWKPWALDGGMPWLMRYNVPVPQNPFCAPTTRCWKLDRWYHLRHCLPLGPASWLPVLGFYLGNIYNSHLTCTCNVLTPCGTHRLCKFTSQIPFKMELCSRPRILSLMTLPHAHMG